MISPADLMRDGRLLGKLFDPIDSWRSWTVVHKAMHGLPLDADELRIFRECTGRTRSPEGSFREVHLLIGRRGGKSWNVALAAVHAAAFKDYGPYLQPGERATVLCLAADRIQATVVFKYIAGLLAASPVLKRCIERETQDTIDLTNGASITVGTSNYRSVRGRTLAGVICDELCFWQDETTANPDEEVIAAVRPGLATIPGSLLLCLSSPYARRGFMHRAFQEHFGNDNSDVLVFKAPSLVMNPTLDAEFVRRELEKDPARARAEYLAEWRDDVSTYVSREDIERCVGADKELPPLPSRHDYVAFVDPSGGRSDSMTLAIAHAEWDDGDLERLRLVLDCVREVRAPFDPSAVVEEFSQVIRSYHLWDVTGDRYAGAWPEEAFSKFGISYQPSALARSDLYRELLPRINARTVVLLDNERLITQLASLERRTGRNGKDTIDHAPGGQDDLANAAAGALVCATTGRPPGDLGITIGEATPEFEPPADQFLTDAERQELQLAALARTKASLRRELPRHWNGQPMSNED